MDDYLYIVRCVCGRNVTVVGGEIVPCECTARISVKRGVFGDKPWAGVDYDMSQLRYNKPKILQKWICTIVDNTEV